MIQSKNKKEMKKAVLFVSLLWLMSASVELCAQSKTPAMQEKVLFSSKNTELLASGGDTLLLLHSLPNRKELWIYKGSTGSIDKRLSEIYYNAQSFGFAGSSIAYYDVLLDRFVFSTIEQTEIKNFIGASLKRKDFIGVSIPSFFRTSIGWLALNAGSYAHMDNKLFGSLLDDRGQLMITAREVFRYPEELTSGFGMVTGYTAANVGSKVVVASEVSANHYLAKQNGQEGKMLVLTELDEALRIVREVAVVDEFDSKLMDPSVVRTNLDLLNVDNQLALVVRAGVNIYVKLFNRDFVLMKNIVPHTAPSPIIDSQSLALKKGFVVVYTSGSEVRLTYIAKSGAVAKDIQVYKSTDSRLKLKCLLDSSTLYVVIRDAARQEIVCKTISRLDLE